MEICRPPARWTCFPCLAEPVRETAAGGRPFLLVSAFGFACARQNPIPFQTSGHLIHAKSLQVFPVDAPDDFCLVWINDQMTVSILSVAEETVMIYLYMPLLVAVL